MEDNEKIEDTSKIMGYVKGITFNSIKRETQKRKDYESWLQIH